jgi:hypothetical protein
MQSGGSAPQFNAQQVSGQQTNSNIQTAAANSYLNAQNQYTPWGNLIYKEVGQRQMGDGTVSIPEWQVHTELSPSQQGIFDQTQELQRRGLDTAGNVLTRVDQAVGQPIDYSGLQELAPIGTDQSAFRDQAYDALISRGESAIDRAQGGSRTLLKNQGVAEGSEAWRRGMEEFGQARNDLSNQSFINANTLAGQNIQQQGDIYNQSLSKRTQGINERMAQRNQPLLDYQALLGMSGGITPPQWAPPVQSQIANTDVTSPAMMQYQGQLQNYNQQQGASNALMGSLFGLGGSVLGGLAGGPLGGMLGKRMFG